MLKVGPLLKFISDMNPQNTPPRLAFSNWLRGFVDPQEALTPALLERFFWDCLDYPHWSTNRTQLGSEIRTLLEHFNSFYQQRLDLQEIRFPETIQVIELEQQRDIQETLSAHLRQELSPEARFRLRFDGKDRIYAFVLEADGSLYVRCFDRKFTLRDGILEPLRPDLVLAYDKSLRLAENFQHKVEISPYVTAQFVVEHGKAHGACLRGFVFQKLMEFKGEFLSDIPRLHLPIKKLEQFFVDRSSDPEYLALIQKLERVQALIRSGDSDARLWAPTILAQAESLYEQIYTQDRMLSILIRELRFDLEKQGEITPCPPLIETPASDSIN